MYLIINSNHIVSQTIGGDTHLIVKIIKYMILLHKREPGRKERHMPPIPAFTVIP